MLQNVIIYKILYIILEFKFELSFNMIPMKWNERKKKHNKRKHLNYLEERRSEERETNLSLEAQLVVFFTMMNESKENEVRK